MSKESFIKELAPYAQEVQASYYILASLIIAQACLESGYGTSELAIKGKNLFGVKGAYNGESVTIETIEHDTQGEIYKITADFKKYPTWLESLEDLANKYKNGTSWNKDLYKGVVGETNYKTAVQIIKNAGYATDVNYVAKVISIIEENKLYEYDTPKVAPVMDSKLYYVQVGAYSSKENAERMATQLKEKGFPAIIK